MVLETIQNADVLRIVVYALAAFRMTHLLWTEDGPFSTFDWIRYKAGVSVFEGQRHSDTFFGDLLNCPRCLSVWFAAIAVGLYVLNVWYVDLLVLWLAMAGVSLLLFGCERQRIRRKK